MDAVEMDGVDLEYALAKVGTGRFHYIALVICGMANAADAVEILGMSLVLPAAGEDLGLDAGAKGALGSCIFLGMLLGASWGLLADRIGRRWSLLLALVVNALFGLLSAVARSSGELMFLRLMAGVGVGGSVPVVFALLAELLPSEARGRYMVGLAAHWMVGSLYSAVMGWVVIPAAGWRTFLVVASLPAWLAAAGVLLLMPESPRFLLIQGRQYEALQVLRHMAASNGTTLPDHLKLMPMTRHNSDSGQLALIAQKQPSSSSWQSVKEGAQLAAAQVRLLFRPPLVGCTLPLLVAWVGLCGGWYSTVLWIPEYFKRRGAEGSSIYAETFAVALANLPGNIASLYMVDRLGRRLTCCICLAGACISALLFAQAPAHGAWPLVAACFFNGISVGGWNSLDVVTTELYPTAVRASGMGLLGAAGRLSSFSTTYLAAALMEKALWLPLLVAAVLLAAGSSAMLALPEPAGRPLEDAVEERGGGGQQGWGSRGELGEEGVALTSGHAASHI